MAQTVNNPSLPEDAHAAERALALGYAPPPVATGLAALLALDARLGEVVRATREPLVGQMRLTWWHDALERLDRAPPPAEPVLTGLAGAVLPSGVTGGAMTAMIDGWEALLDGDPAAPETLALHARARGATLFKLGGQLARHLAGLENAMLAEAGEGWALADLATHLSNPAAAARAADLARSRLAALTARRWPRSLRALGALALLAKMDVADRPRPAGHPLRIGRLLRHRLTGR